MEQYNTLIKLIKAVINNTGLQWVDFKSISELYKSKHGEIPNILSLTTQKKYLDIVEETHCVLCKNAILSQKLEYEELYEILDGKLIPIKSLGNVETTIKNAGKGKYVLLNIIEKF